VRFDDVCFPLSAAWSTPFARWQGPAADTNSLVMAERATRAGLERGGADWPITELVVSIARNPVLNGETIRLDGALRLAPR